MSNTNQFIEKFNAKNRRQRREFFYKLDTTNMRKREPEIAPSGAGASFIFDDDNDICYVYRYYQDAEDELIAYTVEDAEAVLDWHIRLMRQEYDTDILDEGARWEAYINAADELIEAPVKDAVNAAVLLVQREGLRPETAAKRMRVSVGLVYKVLVRMQQEEVCW
jgi:DNA-directed RNA polymerase specialized sigma24 family protein